MFTVSRRRFLASSTIAIAGVATAATRPFRAASAAAATATPLRVDSRVIEVNGKPAKVFGLLQANGTSGLDIEAGAGFKVRLENNSGEPTLVHWHGLLPPYGQDGVPGMPQPLLPSGQAYEYDFPVENPGTHWMHAHTLQEQRLLAAPLIVRDPADSGRDEQDVVVLLHDFSFKPPEELLAALATGQPSTGMTDHGAMPGMSHPGMESMAMDLNDIEYDAYLANDHTLEDPEIHRVEVGGDVRLRLINGATATGFWIDLGMIEGEAVAVDGNPIVPMPGRRFPLGMGQRIDIRLRLPKSEGAWPILAVREGAAQRTGFVLATKTGIVPFINGIGDQFAPPLDLELESGLRASRPLPAQSFDRHFDMTLGGDMAAYLWTINGRTWEQHQPLAVQLGQRVEATLMNQSMMAHPMHLHGHHFQIVAIDGKRMSGAVRDTIWLPPMRSVTLTFDALNPGEWAFHCHHLYHMARGMMTTVRYS
jgi:FtsP/CotA-like multicopper oxidase with cupredoxin domain